MGAQVVNLSGTIVAGPLGSSDCGFPSGVDNIPFSTFPQQKPLASKTGPMARSLNSAVAFVALDGVGATATVQKGTFLYVRTNTKMQIRTTTQPDSGPDVLSVQFVQGVFIQEFPDANYLKLLEAEGVGQIEYFVGGIA